MVELHMRGFPFLSTVSVSHYSIPEVELEKGLPKSSPNSKRLPTVLLPFTY